MKAMILAAGRGERMRPLTDSCPKPLLKVAGKPLIEYHLEKLAKIGVQQVVINLAWLGDKISNYLGDGSRWGLNIHYSKEEEGALETAGGIKKALPVLVGKSTFNEQTCDEPFLVINGDVYCDFNFQNLPTIAASESSHLWLVENPKHNLSGDFLLNNGKLSNLTESKLHTSFTYAGIALFRPSFFNDSEKVGQVFALGPMLRAAADKHSLSGELMTDCWVDVGTPDRLELLNQQLLSNK